MSLAPIAATTAAGGGRPGAIACQPDQGFAQWLEASGGSLAVTTYQAGRLMLVGWDGQQVTFLERGFPRCMGLDLAGKRLALAARGAVWVFEDAPGLAPHYGRHGGYDALYLPRLRIPLPEDPRLNPNYHDLQWSEDADTLWLTNTRFSTLDSLNLAEKRIRPRWSPRFVEGGHPEDRCHLNGLATVDGRAVYASSLGTSNTPNGWRPTRYEGGVVTRIDSGEVLLQGLCMPHSPRWHQGALWVLDSGQGRLLRLAPSGELDTVCELPAFLRGLAFVGDYALVGLCQIREKSDTFKGAPVQQRYAHLLCGVAVIDTRAGRVAGFCQFASGCTEIYDIRFVAGRRRLNVLPLAPVNAYTVPA